MNGDRLGPSDAAILETFVVPRYLSLFGEAALDVFYASDTASIVHLGCRTGYPAEQLAERLMGGSIVGVDPSFCAIELARAKSHMVSRIASEYVVADSLPTPYPDESFTHAISLHPAGLPTQRRAMLREMARLVMPGGQVLLSLPLRGSFQEIIDLLREYAVKHDATDLRQATDVAIASRVTAEGLAEELAAAGFTDVDVDMRPTAIPFHSGRDFVEDPVVRLLVIPELKAALGVTDLAEPLKYAQEAINRYWSEEPFELSVNVGCASGRRAPGAHS